MPRRTKCGDPWTERKKIDLRPACRKGGAASDAEGAQAQVSWEFRFIGKEVARLDTPDKVSGRTAYGIDVKVPGMLIATVQHCPVFGGKVASFDATKAKAV